MSGFNRHTFQLPPTFTPSPKTVHQQPPNVVDEAEDDGFDLDDPTFRSSRSASLADSTKGEVGDDNVEGQHSSPGPAVLEDRVGGWIEDIHKPKAVPKNQGGPPRGSNSPARAGSDISPNRKSHQPIPMSSSHQHSRGSSLEMSFSNSGAGASPPASLSNMATGGFSPSLKPRNSPSVRPHHLNALSPLQSLSPMSRPKDMPRGPSPSGISEAGSLGGRSRSSSVTRSLSRKQSLYRSAESWTKGEEYHDENWTNPERLFSRLTLVRAPSEDKAAALRKRSKSSSALTAPFAGIAPIDVPATSGRAPRRSFAAASFGGFSPLTAVKATPTSTPGGHDAVHRISSIYSADNEAQNKTYTPAEVVEIARGLSSPVVMPEGGFNGAELKRRKSAGASFARRSSSNALSITSNESPDKPPTALEPVEYVQLDEDVLLPFVDRPQEVKDLIEHISNEKLFKLLKAAFPKGEKTRKNWQEIQPEEWYWDEFIKHLTELDRIECPDYAWVLRSRTAVRKHSVALWEKLGVCLGCDGDLLNAGSEDGPSSWGGLGLGDEGEYDGSMAQVWIEGLEAVDPAEIERAEKALVEEFGEIVEDEGMQAAAGMTALLGAIGEEEESGAPGGISTKKPTLTPAQRAGSNQRIDPMSSPSAQFRSLGDSPTRGGNTKPGARPTRSKSFVGLTIMTSPTPFQGTFLPKSPEMTSAQFSPNLEMSNTFYQSDRGPESRLFPSGFSTLSVGPNLGRHASALMGGVKPPPIMEGFHQRGAEGMREGLRRKASGAGLSESAITFASESEYTTSADHYDN